MINFGEFINEERSKNNPIKELDYENLCVVIIGTPGLGKSFFIDNYIKPRRFMKSFSTDDVSLTITKDPNIYHTKSSELNISRILQFTINGLQR